VTTTPRYALYFAPGEGSELKRFGDAVMQRTALANDHPDRLRITEKASHYGFHSTLKAPMELAQAVDADDLLQAVDAFTKTQAPIPLSGLAPEVLDGFHALRVPSGNEVDEFAASVVKTFEAFRAPLTDADRARRNPNALSPTQIQYLDQYGYPFVLDEFRFHMTLSSRITEEAISASYHQWLSALYSSLVTETPVLDRIAVFFQPNRSTDFTRLAEFPVN